VFFASATDHRLKCELTAGVNVGYDRSYILYDKDLPFSAKLVTSRKESFFLPLFEEEEKRCKRSFASRIQIRSVAGSLHHPSFQVRTVARSKSPDKQERK